MEKATGPHAQRPRGGQKATCLQDGGRPASWPERGPRGGGEEGLAGLSHAESHGKYANSSLSEWIPSQVEHSVSRISV